MKEIEAKKANILEIILAFNVYFYLVFQRFI